jgi:hypothetical protein
MKSMVVSIKKNYNYIFLIFQVGYPRKSLAALCQMILHPAYYIPHKKESMHQIGLLEDARNAALEYIEKDRPHQYRYLKKMKKQECFSKKWGRRVAPMGMRSYELGFDETLAPKIALWAIKSYKLDLTSRLPPVTLPGKFPNPVWLKIDDECDYIFDGDGENPGPLIELGQHLQRWRKERDE